VTDILLATDADWIHDEVDAALSGAHTVHRVRTGAEVVDAIAAKDPDVVLLDLQIGNMGGVATCLAVRHADADGWMVKPLDAFRLLRAVEATLAGETVAEAVS